MKARALFIAVLLVIGTKVSSQPCRSMNILYPFLAYELDQEGNRVPQGERYKSKVKCTLNPTSDAEINSYTYDNKLPMRFCIGPAQWREETKNCSGETMSSLIENAVVHAASIVNSVCASPLINPTISCLQPYDDMINVFKQTSNAWQDDNGKIILGAGIPRFKEPPPSFMYQNASLQLNVSSAFTDDYCWQLECPRPVLPNGKRCISIKQVLLHELLHILGVGHTNECIAPDTYRSTFFEDIEKDIMYHKTNNTTILSCYIECALKLKYCPNEISKAGTLTGCQISPIVRSEPPKTLKLNCFPNPTSGDFHAVVESPNHLITIRIINSAGSMLDQTDVNIQEKGGRTLFSFTGLSAGIYYVTVYDGNDLVVSRIIVE